MKITIIENPVLERETISNSGFMPLFWDRLPELTLSSRNPGTQV
jgi:hypothetical protein